MVAAAPPQPVYEKVTLDANVLFDFDKSVLRPAGRDTLDSFVEQAQGHRRRGTIAAVGYADRFGTDGYNQALSERRVATVKAYLVSKGVEPTWGGAELGQGRIAADHGSRRVHGRDADREHHRLPAAGPPRVRSKSPGTRLKQ